MWLIFKPLGFVQLVTVHFDAVIVIFLVSIPHVSCWWEEYRIIIIILIVCMIITQYLGPLVRIVYEILIPLLCNSIQMQLQSIIVGISNLMIFLVNARAPFNTVSILCQVLST